MVFTSYRIESLRKAEDNLFASGLAWWCSWQERHGLPTPVRPTTFEPRDMSTGPKTHVHVVSVTAESTDPNEMPLVCLHGFAHGTSVFYTAAAPLAEGYAGPVFVLDMPGCGLSSRPAYAIADDPEERRLAAENFFCDELEAWRLAMGIERMVLAGHSIGGHSAFAYAERHPERVDRLVLISPAGIPRAPKDFEPKGNSDKPLTLPLPLTVTVPQPLPQPLPLPLTRQQGQAVPLPACLLALGARLLPSKHGEDRSLSLSLSLSLSPSLSPTPTPTPTPTR